jgi:hypothetical protein
MSVTSTTELEANQMSTGLYYLQALLPSWSKRVFSSPNRQGWVWSPTSFLFIWYRGYFPRVRWSGRDVDHSPLSGAEVKVPNNTFTLSMSSWRALAQLYLYLRSKSNLSDSLSILVTPISYIYHRQYFCTVSGNHTNLLNYRLQDIYQSFSSYDK